MSSYGSFPEVAVSISGKGTYGDTQIQSGLVTPPPYSNYGTKTTIANTRYGKSLPGYKRIIASGGNATTGFTASRCTYETTPAQYSYKCNLKPGQSGWRLVEWIYESHGITPLTAPSDPSGLSTKAKNDAQMRFYKRLDSVMTTFQGGTAAAELLETLHMIRNPARALRSGLDAYFTSVKKLKPKPLAYKKKALADTWLEYSFGWAPLLNDLEDAKKAYDKIQYGLEPTKVKLVATGSASSTSFTSGSSGNWANVRWNNRTITTATCRYIGAVSSTIEPDRSLSMMSVLGLHPRNFVPTLWEVIPWSFAIDYFTNIGDVLTAWSLGSVKLQYGTETTRLSQYKDSIYADFVPPSGYAPQYEWQKWVSGHTTATASSVSRKQIEYVPIPDFSFEIPKIGTKWINLSALLASRKAIGPKL